MNQLISSIPKTLFALIVIVIGFGVIMASDPPRTVCDTQLEFFKEAQKAFLYTAKGGEGTGSKPMVGELYELCKSDNSPGGCVEYFAKLRKFVVDLRNIPNQCSAAIGEDDAVKIWMWKSLKLMTQIAWGDRAPASVTSKHGWFDSSDVALFCDLKNSAVRMFGNDVFSEWREAQMTNLPNPAQLSREQIWQKSIFSTSCDSYR